MNRLPQHPDEPSKESLEKAAHYMTHVVHEIEKELIEEIEKIEGKVPLPIEIAKYGVCRMSKDGSMQFVWRGMPIVTAKPNQVNEDGVRGTQLIIHKRPDRKEE